MLRFHCFLCLCLLSAFHASWAQSPVLLEKFGAWSAYVYKTPKGLVCFTLSQPVTTEPKSVKRDPSYFLITHRPSEKIRGEVSSLIGYPFKKGSFLSLRIDSLTFDLFTKEGGAWSDQKDHDIVKAMLNGKTMHLLGTSWRGTKTKDTYQLAGLKKALAKIDLACPQNETKLP